MYVPKVTNSYHNEFDQFCCTSVCTTQHVIAFIRLISGVKSHIVPDISQITNRAPKEYYILKSALKYRASRTGQKTPEAMAL